MDTHENEQDNMTEDTETEISAVEEAGLDLMRDFSAEGKSAGKAQSRGESLTLRIRSNPTMQRRLLLAAAVTALAVMVVIASLFLKDRTGGVETGDSTAESTSADTTAGTDETALREALYAFDKASIPEGMIGYRPIDLSGVGLENKTDHSVDEAALLESGKNRTWLSADGENDAPLVLILHTHATEGYREAKDTAYDPSTELSRSENAEESVVSVGRALADALTNAGIPCLHSEVFHDVKEDGTVTNIGAYERAAETIADALARYPSICIVIDLHRDTVFDDEGNLLRAVTLDGGEPIAQIRAVVGTHSEEGEDLALALGFTDALCAVDPTLARKPLLSENGQHGETVRQSGGLYALTLEIGTAANTYEEAVRAAVLAGEILADFLK